jgi:hypothetical protein
LTEASAFADRQPRASSIGYGEDFHLMTLFNYGYYLSEPMATPDSALAAMFAAMAPGPYAVGGTAFIPQNGFSVDASSTGFSVPDQANIVSSGTGGENSSDTFFHFVISGASTPGP